MSLPITNQPQNTPLNADDRLAPIEWLLDDLLVTIDDATPEELPYLHAKLTALVSGLQGREDEWHPKYRIVKLKETNDDQLIS